MTSNHHALYDLGYTRTTMAVNREKRSREAEQTSEKQSQFGLEAATRLHEAGIASNRGSACRGEPGGPEVGSLTARRTPPKVKLVIGVKS